MKTIQDIIAHITTIENGFKHINEGAAEIMAMYSQAECYSLAIDLLNHAAYQVRMLATALLGLLSAEDDGALRCLKEQVSKDANWRVQEMLAKAFDEVCKQRGYEHCLPLIEEWLGDEHPHVVRAVTEGLRIWTGRPFFKTHPSTAIALLSQHKADKSEYVRKSVGNALRDISKKHRDLVQEEVKAWDLSQPEIQLTYRLATKSWK